MIHRRTQAAPYPQGVNMLTGLQIQRQKKDLESEKTSFVEMPEEIKRPKKLKHCCQSIGHTDAENAQSVAHAAAKLPDCSGL